MIVDNALIRSLLGQTVPTNTAKSPLLQTDPFVQQMNAKYKYTAPDSQPNAYVEGGPGFDFTKNPYGSWDIGNGMALAPKWNMAVGTKDVDPFFKTMDDFSNSSHYKPLNADGTINPNQWAARSTKSGAFGHIMGTLGVLGAAAGSAFWGPSATQAASSAATSGLGMGGNYGGNALSSKITGYNGGGV